MDFSLSPEQEMLRDSARRFVEKDYGFDARRAILATREGWSAAHWRTFAELGWLGIAVPEEAGGFGGGAVDMAILCEELGRGLVVEPFVGCAVMAMRALLAAPPAIRDPLLADLIGGERIFALAHQEPQARGERHLVATAAAAMVGGYRLSGYKSVVLGGAAAHDYLVSARIEGEGLALFRVPAATAGLSVRPYRLVDGSRVVDLELDNAVIGSDGLILPSGAAAPAIEDALDHGIVAMAAEVLGAMDAALWMARDYIKVRRQFGQPIGNFQALQHRMAEMLIEVEQTRSMVYQGLAALAEADPGARGRGIAATKAYVGKSALFACGQAIQLHGGIGMTEECAVGHFYKRVLAFDALLGNQDLQVERYAALLGDSDLGDEAPAPRALDRLAG